MFDGARTKSTGAGVTQMLVDWMKSIFGSAFTVSRGYSAEHDGVDLPAPIGTPVYALKSGVVSYATNAANDPHCASGWACGGGNTVNIDIGNNFTTQFAHLNSIAVQVGQTVQAGQLIGTVGKTGFTVGQPHLHFGLWDRSINKMVDPTDFFQSLGKWLGAWGNIVSFPVGHIITSDDIDTIMEKLSGAGFFNGYALDFLPGEQAPEEKTRQILNEVALGKPWNKSLQDQLQAKFFEKADQEGQNPITAVGAQLADTLTWLGVIFVGITIVIGGILLVKSPSSTKEE